MLHDYCQLLRTLSPYGTPTTPVTPTYGHDIDGLRAVATLLVVGQWVEASRWLLRSAAVLQLATLIARFLKAPDNRLPDLFKQAWASLLYVENWWLAIDATDYHADKLCTIPVQHFWSFSAQGQAFLLCPLLFLLIRLFSQRSRIGVSPGAMVVFALLFASTFVYSAVSTNARQECACFDKGRASGTYGRINAPLMFAAQVVVGMRRGGVAKQLRRQMRRKLWEGIRFNPAIDHVA